MRKKKGPKRTPKGDPSIVDIRLATYSPIASQGAVWGHFFIGGWTEAKAAPEPKDEPKTVIGLTGYRLYTLDSELYLCGQQGNRQKGRESEQAKHNGRIDTLGLNPEHSVSHPAPAWDCVCGFAAFFWPTSLERPSWHGVLAEVQAGGRTIVCETGWRAERIALSKLWIACPIFPDAALETLRERYEIPVEVL